MISVGFCLWLVSEFTGEKQTKVTVDNYSYVYVPNGIMMSYKTRIKQTGKRTRRAAHS